MITKEQIEEIQNRILGKGFLDRDGLKFFCEKFDLKLVELKKLLLENKIPHKGKFNNLLNKFGVEVIDKKINLLEFNKLGYWRIELFENSKLRAMFNCKECGEHSNSRLAKMIGRKFFSLEPICSGCIVRKVTNTDEWKKTNSDAQIIAQNKPEAKERMSNIVKKRFDDPDYRKKASNASLRVWERPGHKSKMSDIARKRWENPEYAKKVIQNCKNGGYSGFYKNLYYDSGYELAWMMMVESEGNFDKISRANMYISYKNKKGKSSCYYPDFILDGKFLVEVKGYGPWVDIEQLNLKNTAAKVWCKENKMSYRLVELKDFRYFWYGKAIKKHKELNNGKTGKQKNK